MMSTGRTPAIRPILLAVALLVGGAMGPAPGAGQGASLAMSEAVERAAGAGISTALARGRYAVVIDLDRNRLYFKRGAVTLWDAPIGTGTGLRLRSDDGEWDFSTPNGVFQVKFKERNPTWVAPDWYFVENGLPVPPQDDPKRLFPGGLGAAAVYLEHDLAIHGTDRPELLGQRVSHGCIRLENRYALRLFHNVQVGTEVIIVGGEEARRTQRVVDARNGKVPSTFNPKRTAAAPRDPVVERWQRLSTGDLLALMEEHMLLDDSRSRWAELATLLLERGQRDDEALKGLLRRSSRPFPVRRRHLETEYATFLADAFGRAPVRTLEVLSTLDPVERRRAAEAIVTAGLNLYHGSFDDPATPWPTRRLPYHMVTPASERGWQALTSAEEAYRRGLDAQTAGE